MTAPVSGSVQARSAAAMTRWPIRTRGRSARPGDDQDTLTARVGSLPHVRCTCSGVPSAASGRPRAAARAGPAAVAAMRPVVPEAIICRLDKPPPESSDMRRLCRPTVNDW